ncbi:MAG: hypothetical protein ABSD27_07835 [Bryobacteraceae bacterium]
MASDLALDEARGVVYVANFTANRIDVISLQTKRLTDSINVPPQPSSLALSPDGRYLLVTHLSNFKPPLTPYNGLTILNLSTSTQQKLTFASPPMGVAFGYDGLALVVTTTDFVLLDPDSGYIQTLATVDDVITPKQLPSPVPPLGPRAIIRASMTASANMNVVWGIIEVQDAENTALIFCYDAVSKLVSGTVWIAQPPMGPRVISTNRDGTRVIAGWGLWHEQGFLLAQFPDALGNFSVGSHAIDSGRGLVYAQVPDSKWTSATPPVMIVADSDNLNVREQLKLNENLSGRSVLSADGSVMYAISDSGLTILPVGSLTRSPQVTVTQEDVVFRGNWCHRGVLTQDINIVDPGGNRTDFELSTTMPGVTFSQTTGTTPATVTITVDMSAFQDNKGTITGFINVTSAAGVNVIPPVRVLINNREPDQRGTIFDVPGTLVSVLADPARNRFYVLRQDKDLVLVFDGSNYSQIATLRTGNTPWSMAITFDRKYLIIGADNSQVAHVYNLDTLQLYRLVIFPGGHYPRWIAASARAILAACRVAGPIHVIDQIQLPTGIATQLPSLGVWENNIDIDTALVASPTGASILGVEANGRVMIYDANADTFAVARTITDALSGAVAALSDDTYIVDNLVLNASGVPVQALETASGSSSGFALVDGLGLRTTAPDSSSPGVIQRVDFALGASVRPTRMIEAPVIQNKVTVTIPGVCNTVFVGLCTPDTTETITSGATFLRTLAPLANGNAIISLTTSGFTVLAWTYDQAVAAPHIDAIVNAADRTPSVAPGGLFTVSGSFLSPTSAVASEVPLPTALADSCMTINGALVPLIFVSPSTINGQIPFNVSGAATMILRTTAGVSNSFRFTLLPVAPAIFRVDLTASDGWITSGVATVVRAANNELVTPTNPIQPGDWLVIYTTGMGLTTPDVKSGYPGPTDPLALTQVQPTVFLDGVELPISYSGLAPGQVGVDQINVQVPFSGLPRGMAIPLTITQGNYQTTVNVRVVD